MADKINFPLISISEFDGILGLAYPNIIAQSQNIVPVFENLMSKNLLKKNIFSIHVHENGGSLIWGDWDNNLKENKNDPFVWVPLAERNYWTFFIIDMYVVKYENGRYKEYKNPEKMCPKGCSAVIDTGSYYIYGSGARFKVNIALCCFYL